jgi:glucose/mannose-6-phosphate isomerase
MTLEESLDEMDRLIADFPDNMLEAIEIGQKSISTFKTDRVDNILIAGLGGSGIGGKIMSEMVWDSCKVPICLVHNYDIPAWVSEHTLFVACSYSGNTEETLSALEQAMQKGAQITCITSGGKLQALAESQGFNIIKIPGGQPPRTSFGYNAMQQLFVFQAFGLLKGRFTEELAKAADLLKKEQSQIRVEASAIANKLSGTIPVIYAETQFEGVAVRLRQQLNENAKMLCWHHTVPEMNHNELVGWAGGDKRFSVIFIRTPEDNERSALRMDLNQHVIRNHTDNIVELRPKGHSRIEQVYYLIHLSDWISQYLARENGINPMEIEVINQLKGALAKNA